MTKSGRLFYQISPGRKLKLDVVQLLSRVQLFETPRLQHAGLPCPSPSTRVCSNSCSLCWWCYPTISSSVIPFSSCPQSLKLKWLEGRVHTVYGLLDSIFVLQEFSYVFFQVWPFIHIIANNRIRETNLKQWIVSTLTSWTQRNQWEPQRSGGQAFKKILGWQILTSMLSISTVFILIQHILF